MGKSKMMDHSCGTKCLKYSLVILHVFCLLDGVVLAGVAGYQAFSPNSTMNKLTTKATFPLLYDGLYTIFAVGLSLVVIAIIGLWGVLNESKGLLIFYFLATLLLFFVLLAGAIIILTKYDQIKEKALMAIGGKVRGNPMKAILYKLAVAKIEHTFHCCGVYGPQDYAGPKPRTCYVPILHHVGRRSVGSNNTASVSTTTMERIPPPVLTSASGTIAPSTSTTSTTMLPTTTSVAKLYQNGCAVVASVYVYLAGALTVAIMVEQILALALTCFALSGIKHDYIPLK